MESEERKMSPDEFIDLMREVASRQPKTIPLSEWIKPRDSRDLGVFSVDSNLYADRP